MVKKLSSWQYSRLDVLSASLDDHPASWTGFLAFRRRSDYREAIESAPLYTEIGTSTTGAQSLGSTLRAIRTARGLSLAQVAKETGISRSLLSLIETGRSDITVGRLTRLARLYEIRLADLVPEPRHPDPVIVRADDRVVMHYDAEGIDVEVLSPEGQHTLQALLATFAPHARMQDYIPQPNEQFTHVIAGQVRTEFADGRSLELDEGDSATFLSGEGGHRHINLSDGVTRMVIVLRRPRRP
jgi:transcriptional regulator with XRE-family HTH domain